MRATTRRVGLVLFALTLTAVLSAAHAAAAMARPWLGVYTQEITGELRDGMGLPGDAGVLVNRVVAGGPAARAGLRSGDVIVRLDSHRVESPQELARMVGDARERQVVRLEIMRNGERHEYAVTLAALPAGDAPDAPPAPPAPERLEDMTHRDGKVQTNDREDADRHVRVKIQRDGGSPQVFDFDGNPDQLPGHVREMLRDLPGLDGNGGLHALRVAGAPRGRLGVRIESLSPDLASALGAPGDEGVLVLEVMKDTPAERAGLRAGDVILTVGGTDVKDAEALVSALRDADDRVSITVSRRGTRRTVEAELASAPRTGVRGEDQRVGRGAPDRGDRAPALDDEEDTRDLRQQMDELRQQLRELRQQLQDRRHE